jgi:hypothetical protein
MHYQAERRKELYSKYKVLFDLLDRVSHLVEEVVNENKRISFNSSDLQKEIIWFLSGKAIKTFYASKLLCEQGYGTDSLVLCRGLIEILISITYINEKDSQNRALQFIDYEWVIKKEFLLRNKLDLIKSVRNLEEENKFALKVDENYQKFLAKHPQFKKNRNLPWTGEKKIETARRLGLEYLYEIVFSYTSDLVHSSASSISHYVKDISKELRHIEIGPSDTLMEQAVGTSGIIILMILQEIDKVFDFNKKDKIFYLKDLFQKRLKNKTKTPH